jgi:hypothetical protein
VSDEAVIREALERDSTYYISAGRIVAGQAALDRLVARLEAAERERDEANSSWEQAHRGTLKIAEAWHARAEAAEAALAEARAALEHIANPNYSARPTGRDALDMAAFARAALTAAGETAVEKHACQRCGSTEWEYVDYGGCSECRPHAERAREAAGDEAPSEPDRGGAG